MPFPLTSHGPDTGERMQCRFASRSGMPSKMKIPVLHDFSSHHADHGDSQEEKEPDTGPDCLVWRYRDRHGGTNSKKTGTIVLKKPQYEPGLLGFGIK
jgi:hypothetical protein